MKTSLLKISCLLAIPLMNFAFSSPAYADSSDLSSMDKSFAKKAAIGGMFEVESSQIVQDKGASDDVKAFAARMVTDHSKANDELKGIASTKGLTLPTTLDTKHEALWVALKARSGEALDKAYLEDMTTAHSQDDALFMKESSMGKDADLKAFATKTDEVIKHHIEMLNDVKSKMAK
jgi:putative membrane protein